MNIEEFKIGPSPCPVCGGEYGDHREECKRKAKMIGEVVGEAEMTKNTFLPVLRWRYGDDISFFDGVGKMWGEVKDRQLP